MFIELIYSIKVNIINFSSFNNLKNKNKNKILLSMLSFMKNLLF